MNKRPLGVIVASTARLLFATLALVPLLWINQVLRIYPVWNVTLVITALLAVTPATWWQKLPRFRGVSWSIAVFLVLAVAPLVTGWLAVQQQTFMALLYLLTLLVLLGIHIVLRRKDALLNLSMATLGLGLALVLANLGAGLILSGFVKVAGAPPTVTNGLQQEPTSEPKETQEPTVTPAPTSTVDPASTPFPTATPEPERPVAGFGYLEWLEDNGETEWTHRTGYGPRKNSVAHAFMLDADGEVIYDNVIEFNGNGYRGPEVSYEKSEDVYRILIIGDSFVEAIQVDYAETFYALLQDELEAHNNPSRRYEVIAMGRTGWGTPHEAIFYQVEGYRYQADLVILMFYINDVADSFPVFFYPNINNTNYEFLFEDDTIQIVDTNKQPLPPNTARMLYNALPSRLQQTNLARLIVRLGDPPTPVMTPGGVMTRVHPQFYIYVTEPEVEGYEEAWARTGAALKMMAEDVAENDGRFVVVPIFIGSELITSVSGWFPELTESWQWDERLPEMRLQELLDGLRAELVLTRPGYNSYAASVGGEVHNLLFLPGDGHFSQLGHQVTKDVLYGWLQRQGIVKDQR